MSVAFDATFLMPLLFPGALGPIDPATDKPLEFLRERLDYLVRELESSQTKIIIPTPALSELLVHAGPALPVYLDRFREYRSFKIEAFDTRAAVEVAIAIGRNISQMGKKRGTNPTETWAKVKFDFQIVAIAKVNGASSLYSDDKDVQTFGSQVGLTVVRSWELPLPPTDVQMDFDLKTAPKPPPSDSETQ